MTGSGRRRRAGSAAAARSRSRRPGRRPGRGDHPRVGQGVVSSRNAGRRRVRLRGHRRRLGDGGGQQRAPGRRGGGPGRPRRRSASPVPGRRARPRSSPRRRRARAGGAPRRRRPAGSGTPPGAARRATPSAAARPRGAPAATTPAGGGGGATRRPGTAPARPPAGGRAPRLPPPRGGGPTGGASASAASRFPPFWAARIGPGGGPRRCSPVVAAIAASLRAGRCREPSLPRTWGRPPPGGLGPGEPLEDERRRGDAERDVAGHGAGTPWPTSARSRYPACSPEQVVRPAEPGQRGVVLLAHQEGRVGVAEHPPPVLVPGVVAHGLGGAPGGQAEAPPHGVHVPHQGGALRVQQELAVSSMTKRRRPGRRRASPQV